MKARTLWRPMQILCVFAILVGIVGVPGAATPRAMANHTTTPASVNLAGSLQSEATDNACGDWDPGCAGSAFTAAGNGVYAFTSATIPAGSYDYKVALGSWNENYGSNFQQGGPDIPLALAAARAVKFYYDHKTHYIADNVRNTIYTVPGSFNSALGCADNWQPDCLHTLMSDVDGDGVYTFSTKQLPAGSYELKVATDESWDVSYGAGSGNVAFTVPLDGVEVTVSFNEATKAVSVAAGAQGPIYTLPGSFNNELGCAEDWQPSCLRTKLSDEDGDGVYTFSTDQIPPGSYEFKVAVGGKWDESYGVNGNNVAFSVPVPGLAVTFSFNEATKVPAVSAPLPPAPPAGDAALVKAPVFDVPNQGEVFYFVLPDRFANGNPANDTGGLAGDVLSHGFLPNDKGYYHGGDLKGLREKLPYLRDLGVTAIWMTPMFKNRAVQCDSTKPASVATCSAAYHGYWPVDFTQIDPHFGTNAEMKDFVAAANNQYGMRVFFDIITNHTGDVIDYENKNYTYVPRSDAPYRDAGGNVINDRDYLFAKSFPELNRYSFPKRPVFRSAADATAKFPLWLNDVTMYHNRGDAAFDGSEGDIYGDFSGLDGLFTERPEVVDGLIDIHKTWIKEFGIDGFRVDTVKHVNMEFWQQFVPEIREYAAEQGKPDFFIFGEVFSGDPAYMSQFTREGKFPATLDFAFNERAGNFATGANGPGTLSALFAGDDYYTTVGDNAYNQPTFLGNHDIGRLGNRVGPVSGGQSDDERVKRMLLAYGTMFTSRGVPIIYYGDEQGFVGDGGDKDARQTLFASQVGSYNDDDLIGTDKTTASDNYNQDHPLYQGLKELAALRAANPALQSGNQIERLAEDGGAGIYAFSRIDRDAKVEYVVALNNAETAKSISIQTFAPQGASFQGIFGAGGSVTANPQGKITVTVPALGLVVYEQTAATPINPAVSSLGSLVTLTAPAAGGNVPAGQVEVAASVAGNTFAEVSFAVSVNGGPFQPLGTDTNAPYRVFYDASKVPGGASLTFKAVSTNLLGPAGNFNSATSTVKVGVADVCTVKYEYAVIHYSRPDGNYQDWGVHVFGDAVAQETTWDNPIRFLGRTEYGAFAWVRLKDPSKPLGFIVHGATAANRDAKDPDVDRFFTPKDTPQVFLKSGDAAVYPSQAAAQGYVTFNYSRPDGNYDGAVLYVFGEGADASETANAYPGTRAFTGEGPFRSVTVKVGDPTKPLGFIVIKNGVKDPDGDRSIIPAVSPSVWLKSADAKVYRSRSEAEGVVTLRYHRPAGDYGTYTSDNFNDFWGLHTWAGTKNPNPAWNQPLKPVGAPDSFGVTFRTELAADATTWAYILHKGDAKDKQSDQSLNLAETGNEIWVLQEMPGAYPYLLPVQPGCRLGLGDVSSKQRAHFVSADTIAWPIVASPLVTYQLHVAPNGGMSFANGQVQGAAAVADLTLDPAGLSDAVKAKFPHLKGLTALKLPAGADVKALLKGQLWVSARTEEQGVVEVTGVQIPGALDDLYAAKAAGQNLGLSFSGNNVTFRLWAPTAQDVKLKLFPTATGDAGQTVNMALDANTGIWSATQSNVAGQYYLYEVKVFAPTTGKVETNLVSDPYSVSLAMNSTRSQVADLTNPALKPAGWDALAKPRLDAFEDVVLYELHVRDFSITDASVPEAQRGTFKAFTQLESNGMRHLRALARDGLTHVHLLPIFDIATIEEDKSKRTEILGRFTELRALPGNSEEQQKLVGPIRDLDGFNWGYDPYHYNVPEGSYSTNPEGTTRVVEFREMVRSLNQSGLRVVVDVVYNHTNAAGQNAKSVLDKVVPGYYHRLDADGLVATSTCCQNTATENAMMRKLMVDSIVLWAKQYKVDGFRFDLMGHHMKADMLAVRQALDALTVAKDGVDGKKIVLYGEGWNFGEVADGARGVNATQRNMPGTGIGTFSDRLRDAVRGGGPFDSGEGARKQGFISGLFYDPNGTNQGSAEDQKRALLNASDMIKVGLAGNLASFTLTNSLGGVVKGEDVDYNGSPGGYTRDPQEVITYIEAHDNETLFDAIQLKAPAGASLADRVRMQNMGISIVMLGQGIPFFQAGQEFLRSKSGDRNSYNSGDWFNRVDWTLTENNWGSGLPYEDDNRNNWDVLRPVLADPALKPRNAEMVSAYEHFREMLRIRKSTPLFRLRTAAEVNAQVSFLNNGPDQIPGLIVMRIQDNGQRDLDAKLENVVVLFNASDTDITFTAAELRQLKLSIHDQQRLSFDKTVRRSHFIRGTGTFTIPARTTAVFTDR